MAFKPTLSFVQGLATDRLSGSSLSKARTKLAEFKDDKSLGRDYERKRQKWLQADPKRDSASFRPIDYLEMIGGVMATDRPTSWTTTAKTTASA